jgi:D-3-phosphoglycerate dehydrogenase
MLILIADAFGPELPARLAPFGEVTDDKSRAAEADVVLVRSATKVTREYIDAAKNLKMVIRGGVGLDNIDVAHAEAKGIEVHNTPAASAPAVAEHAFALMLASASLIVKGHLATVVEKRWAKKELKRTELLGKTLGLIGVGRIGTELALRAKAFGMTVVATDPFVKAHDVVEMVSLDELLARADYISLHVPLTDETCDMVNAALIARMKDGVTIVNTARGKCIVEADLAAALVSGKVRAAGLDVYQTEPLADSPLLGAPNVILLPHIGASTKENLTRIGEIIVEKVGEFAGRG